MTLSHLQGHSLLEAFRCDFCQCNAMLARYWLSLCVCLSICLSQVRVIPNRLHIGSCKQCCTIAQGLSSFTMQKISMIFWWNHPNGCGKCRWGRQKLRFTTDPDVSISDALPPNICVHLPWWSASPSTMVRWRKNMRCHQHLTLMLVKIWWSLLWSSWHQHGGWHWQPPVLTVQCDSWTIHVQRYAGSGIKRDSCWKCSSG